MYVCICPNIFKAFFPKFLPKIYTRRYVRFSLWFWVSTACCTPQNLLPMFEKWSSYWGQNVIWSHASCQHLQSQFPISVSRASFNELFNIPITYHSSYSSAPWHLCRCCCPTWNTIIPILCLAVCCLPSNTRLGIALCSSQHFRYNIIFHKGYRDRVLKSWLKTLSSYS